MLFGNFDARGADDRMHHGIDITLLLVYFAYLQEEEVIVNAVNGKECNTPTSFLMFDRTPVSLALTPLASSLNWSADL